MSEWARILCHVGLSKNQWKQEVLGNTYRDEEELQGRQWKSRFGSIIQNLQWLSHRGSIHMPFLDFLNMVVNVQNEMTLWHEWLGHSAQYKNC